MYWISNSVYVMWVSKSIFFTHWRLSMYMYTVFQHFPCPPWITNTCSLSCPICNLYGWWDTSSFRIIATCFLSLNQSQASIASAQVCSRFPVSHVDKNDKSNLECEQVHLLSVIFHKQWAYKIHVFVLNIFQFVVFWIFVSFILI